MFRSFVRATCIGNAPIVPVPPVNLPRFRADATVIAPGQCTTLRWQVTGSASAIYLLDSSAKATTQVGPSAIISVCPQVNTTYTLRVIGADGRRFDQTLGVNVAQGPTPVPPPTPMP